jgi:hypothetical protein
MDSEFRYGHEGIHRQSGGLDRGTSPLFTIHNRQDAKHFSTGFPEDLYGLEGGAAGRDDVFDDNDGITSREASLDASCGAVGLGLLAHSERVQVPAHVMCCVGDGVGDWIGSEREPTDRARVPLVRVETIQSQEPDQG